MTRALEALVDGDVGFAEEALRAGLDEPASSGVQCPTCKLRFRWPGERDTHVALVHFEEAA
jgi:hypothetical protein